MANLLNINILRLYLKNKEIDIKYFDALNKHTNFAC